MLRYNGASNYSVPASYIGLHEPMDFQELISRLALALGIGLLFGLERGWRAREERPGGRAAGIRTFAISGVLGGMIGAIGHSLGSTGGGVAMGLGFAAYGATLAVFCLEENRAQQDLSATTWVAAMLTFALGIYAVVGDMRVAAGVAVASTLILALREPLHGWVEKLTWPELRSALVLLAMTFIALPIVPDDPIGPFGGVNPREVWVIAIVLAGASFVGYVAVKYFGARHGVLLAGAAGGLASSTAVTIINARRAASHEGPARLLAAGVAMASAIMFVRVCAIVLAVNASLFVAVASPLLAAAAVAVATALIAAYWRRPEGPEAQAFKFRNPFAFWSVVGFALFLGAVIVVGRVIGEWFGGVGAIVGAAVVGLVDVDAITVSLARLTPQPLGTRDATIAILSAVATDTISKIAIGCIIGRSRFAIEITIMAVSCLVAGAAALWATLTYLAN
jgi:uncharacterized membrane protein (DUF4010 family)